MPFMLPKLWSFELGCVGSFVDSDWVTWLTKGEVLRSQKTISNEDIYHIDNIN